MFIYCFDRPYGDVAFEVLARPEPVRIRVSVKHREQASRPIGIVRGRQINFAIGPRRPFDQAPKAKRDFIRREGGFPAAILELSGQITVEKIAWYSCCGCW